MKLFVLGKRASITHWLEDCVAALIAEGHEVRVGVTRDPRLSLGLDTLAEGPRAAALAKVVRRFGPDLILAIGAYHIPPAILRAVTAVPGRPPLVGWVGDIFTEAARASAALLDTAAYTDTGLKARHESLGFPGKALYLAHAVNPHLAAPAARPRRPMMLFVANPTPLRRAVICALSEPMVIMGPAWAKFDRVAHEIHARRVAPSELAGLYASHLAALNIRNEGNVLDGLNQRNFAPYLFSTPVVTEAQADLAAAFEPGQEVLVYRTGEELVDIYARLQGAPLEAAAIADRGRRRVLAEHTYGRRLQSLLDRL